MPPPALAALAPVEILDDQVRRREGTQVFYRMENEHIGQLVTNAIHNAEHASPGVPGHHLADAELVRLHDKAGGA